MGGKVWHRTVTDGNEAVGPGELVGGKVCAETFRLCSFVGLSLLGVHLALRALV